MSFQNLTFYLVTVGFVAGVFIRSLQTVSLPVTLLILLIATGLIMIWWRARFTRGASTATVTFFLTLSLFLIAFAVGSFRMTVAEALMDDTVLHPLVGQETTIVGQVIREPDIRESTTLLTLATMDTRLLVRTERYTDVSYGDTLSVTGEIELPSTFTTELGREFNYPQYLEARGVTHLMAFPEITIVSEDTGSLGAHLYAFKELFLSRLSLVIDPPAYGLGAGLLLGVQSALGEALLDDFRTAGIVHIVVLSGYNIMLVVAFVLYVTAFILPYRARLVFGIGAVILFAMLVGYSPSVLRASVMAILFLIASLLARPYDVLRMLVFAGAIMIMWNPYILLFDIGFQLSFVATLGLVLVAPQLEVLWHRVTAWLSVRTFLVATVATQIAVAPLILYYIGEWSLIAVPVNLLTLPMVPVAMLLTFLTGVIALFSTILATLIGFFATWSLNYIIAIASSAATLPFATVTIPAFSPYLIPVLYGFMGLLWYWWRSRSSRRFPNSTTPNAVQTETSSWTIELEEDFMSKQTRPESPVIDRTNQIIKERAGLAPARPDELPIFFR